MAIVAVSPTAIVDLERLIDANQLPTNTRERVARSVRVLSAFPMAGRELVGAWSGYRFWIGPWQWMLVVYEYVAERDAVTVVAIHDGRASSAATALR